VVPSQLVRSVVTKKARSSGQRRCQQLLVPPPGDETFNVGGVSGVRLGLAATASLVVYNFYSPYEIFVNF
jgi:hypothetical protein